jgi:outer membrane protein TolC
MQIIRKRRWENPEEGKLNMDISLWSKAACLSAICLVWTTTLCASAQVHAQAPVQATAIMQNSSSGSGALSLQEAIKEALHANPGILAVNKDIQAASDEVKASRGLLFGEVDAQMTYQHLNDAQLLRPMSGPITPAAIGGMPFAQDQMHLGVVYAYPLYVGGKIDTRIKIAQLGVEQARALLTGTTSDVVYNVTALYIQSQALTGQAKAIQQEIDELNVTRKDTALGVKVGKRPEVDLLKIDDRISEAQSLLTSILSQQKRLISAMMAVMGRSGNEQPSLEPLPETLPQLSANDSDLLKQAQDRSSIKIASFQTEQAKKRISLARAEIDPAVALQASYFQHVDPSVMDRTQETWFVGLAVNFPLIDGGFRRSELARSKEEAKAYQNRLIGVKLQADVDLQNALTSWQSAQDQVKAADAQFASAHEVGRIEQLRYDTGAGDIEDLLRARTREVAAESAQISARALVIVSGAQINRVTEKEIVR